VPDYANLYRFGDVVRPGALVLYVGGSIEAREHDRRFKTQPTPILAQVTAALERTRVDRLDVIIAPSPPRERASRATLLDDYHLFFLDRLLPALGARPTALAFVGYSFGAHRATYLALLEERARALVSLGGAHVGTAARSAGRMASPTLTVALFHNAEDSLPPPLEVLGAFPSAARARVMAPRPGGSAFEAYAANGTVADGFTIAMEAAWGGATLA
jgi:hypothetical protein